MRANLNALYLIEERLVHAFGRRAKRANLKRAGYNGKSPCHFGHGDPMACLEQYPIILNRRFNMIG